MSALTDLFSEIADDEEPLKLSRLLQISGLSEDEIAEFSAEWDALPQARKVEMLDALTELGEDNLELDFAAIFKSTLEDRDDEVREKSAHGLWESDDRSAIRPLIAALLEDSASGVRAAAGLSLRKFALMAQNGKLIVRDGDRLREALLTVVKNEDEDVEVQRRAIEALGCFDSPGIDEIISRAYGGADLMLKQSSLFAMGQSSNAKWLSRVIDELEHDSPAIRYEAANATGLLGDESSAPDLVNLVRDEDPQVQMAAVRALGGVGGPLAKKALQEILASEDESLEEVAREALSSIEFDADPLAFRFES